MKIKFEINVHFKNPLEVVVMDHHRKPQLRGPIAVLEQESAMPPAVITGVSITDSQLIAWGPFFTVDKKGRQVGAVGDLTIASTDPLVATIELWTEDVVIPGLTFQAGMVLVRASNDPNATVPGDCQVSVDDQDPNTTPTTLDVNVRIGPPVGIQGGISDAVEQP